MTRDVPSASVPTLIAPVESVKTIWPLPATPNGAGTVGWEVPAISTVIANANSRRRSAIAMRIGTRGAVASRPEIAVIGSHLSMKVQPGRCRVRATWKRMSS